jgi:Carboxypeptidase regulatory-like domain
MRGLRILSVVVGFIAMTSEPAFAQTVSATTGAINGKVADESAGALPGVAITITSPAMQGDRTTVSGPDGSFRFPAIPPGTYQVTYELAGFATVAREGVVVGLGFTATLNVEMKVASLQGTVTSPVRLPSSTSPQRSKFAFAWTGDASSAGDPRFRLYPSHQARFRTFQTSSVGHLRAQSVVTN